MKRLMLMLVLMAVFLSTAASAQADWRWAPPKAEKRTVTTQCNTMTCLRDKFRREETRLKNRIAAHDKRRLAEWKRWTKTYIARCTWFGESGETAQFARVRYTILNAQGSGARGKYQMMPGTYKANAKYGDWSPLDQEIAGHREFAKHGIYPWSNCTS